MSDLTDPLSRRPDREKGIQGHRGRKSGCPHRKHSGRRRRKRQSKRDCQSKCTEYPAKEYDIEEEDFLSAEIEVVPAGAARDYGFDRSMVMGYGHDDRVCAYPSFRAMLEVDTPEVTSVCLLVRQRRNRKCRCNRYAVTFLRKCSSRSDGALRSVFRVGTAPCIKQFTGAFFRCQCSI